MHGITARIDRNGYRHVLDLELPDGFHSEVFEATSRVERMALDTR